MPELPEVETVVRGLAQEILGKTTTAVVQNRADLRFPLPKNFGEQLENRTIKAVLRRAKYILVYLDNQTIWMIHLGMSGQILVHRNMPNASRKHDHVVVTFTDRSVLIFNDPRRFGMMDIVHETDLQKHKLLEHLGPEPLHKSFDGKALAGALQNKKTAIKTAIMDQQIVVGVGNIYASESLFRSRIKPTRSANKVTAAECETLAKNIKAVLLSAIDSGGSTLRDFVRSSGDAGYFQHEFQVYDRENAPCTICQSPIKRITQQNRSTYYCPTCQKN